MSKFGDGVSPLQEGAQGAGVPRERRCSLSETFLDRLLIGLAGLLWLGWLWFPSMVAGDELDPSWQQAYAYFLTHRLQAGTDYIFTYGPLGWFMTPAFDSRLYWPRFLWEIGIKLALVFNLMRLLRRIPHKIYRIAAVVLLFSCVIHQEVVYCLLVITSGVSLLTEKNVSLPRLFLFALVFALLAHIKGTFLFRNVIIVALAEGRFRIERRPFFLSPLALFAALYLIIWLALGQSLSSLLPYWGQTGELTSGYSTAMIPRTDELGSPLFGLLTVALLLGAIALFYRAAIHRSPLLALLLLTNLFFAWKSGVVRYDWEHHPLLFGSALGIALLLPGIFPTARPRTVIAKRVWLASLLLSFAGAILLPVWDGVSLYPLIGPLQNSAANAATLLNPWNRLRHLEASLAAQKRTWALPEIGKCVGDATIDELPYQQGVVLLNDFHWTPRPIFQSYSIFTPALQTRNTAFLSGDKAPDYLLCRLEAIDQRLPAQEEGLGFVEILRRYRPALTEKNFLLLRRCSGPKRQANETSGEPETVKSGTARFYEEVEVRGLSKKRYLLALHFTPTIGGRAVTLLYRGACPTMHITLEDGTTLPFRLIPGMVENGFFFNPLILNNEDIKNYYAGGPGRAVRSFRIGAPGHIASRMYRQSYSYSIKTLPDGALENGVKSATLRAKEER